MSLTNDIDLDSLAELEKGEHNSSGWFDDSCTVAEQRQKEMLEGGVVKIDRTELMECWWIAWQTLYQLVLEACSLAMTQVLLLVLFFTFVMIFAMSFRKHGCRHVDVVDLKRNSMMCNFLDG